MRRDIRTRAAARASIAIVVAATLITPVAIVAAAPVVDPRGPASANAGEPAAAGPVGAPLDSLTAQEVEVDAEALMPPVAHDAFSVGPPPVESRVAGLGVIELPAAATLAWPVIDPTISSPFGARDAPCAGCSTFHDGVDYTPGAGTPVMTIADGTVILVTEGSEGLGTHIEIQHNIEGRVFTSTYGHLEAGSPQVSVGDVVTAGQSIGRVGSTGQSTGPHLHLELYAADGVRLDADAWLRARMLR